MATQGQQVIRKTDIFKMGRLGVPKLCPGTAGQVIRKQELALSKKPRTFGRPSCAQETVGAGYQKTGLCACLGHLGVQAILGDNRTLERLRSCAWGASRTGYQKRNCPFKAKRLYRSNKTSHHSRSGHGQVISLQKQEDKIIAGDSVAEIR
ncbi:hypothetical protein AVEN_102445-1 [Araneus ventricosus]|uniref:Uncharacterized protein n=1 Tax=Araneus ventricosus TaxID=182803 RepID=A0A4Y1ZUY4_ARAVE|nr:hypothetical protein AVEN_102445-1 [Araneus ventricosus]